MEPLLKAAAFLIDISFGIYIFLLMLRFLAQWARVDFTHPLAQFLYVATNPPLRPLRRFVPHWRGLELSALVLMLVLQLIKRTLLTLLIGMPLSLSGLLLMSVAELLQLLLYTFIFALIIQAVLSFVNPDPYNPLATFLHRITEPLLRPIRRRLPPVQQFDFSPMVAIIGLYLLMILLVEPLLTLGLGL